ncbi:MAG: hypothetical protein JOZ46_09710 [Candidatus Dormibacteraeota bacterium]|nr:hypothetical protein [Candidatus Dormibacteraeota bacterium]MBV9526072.1 hypothetical protein [Candidatus Dormibacteraeota bacterium]
MSRLAAAALLTALLAAACGGGGAAAPSWRASHPDPNGLTFDEQAPGLCALTVQYPDSAPAAIEYQGGTYVQRSRAVAPPRPSGAVVARSGDWTITQAGGGLAIDTGADLFTYRLEASC